MPLADYDAYLDALRLNRAADFQQSAASTTTIRQLAMWRTFVPAPAAPTTSVATDKDTAIAIGPIPASSTGNLCAVGGRLNTSSLSGCAMTLVDVLNHSGGLDGTVTTEQTTNLPTAALTRYTSGEGVMIGLIIYTQLGATLAAVTVRYTNQAGTANQVSTAIPFGGTGFREASRLIQIPLAAGDTGVRSVEGVTLTATTGTAGNFGVVLYKPLTFFALESTTGTLPLDNVSSGGIVGAFQSFDDDACLSCIAVTSINQSINGAILLAEV